MDVIFFPEREKEMLILAKWNSAKNISSRETRERAGDKNDKGQRVRFFIRVRI